MTKGQLVARIPVDIATIVATDTEIPAAIKTQVDIGIKAVTKIDIKIDEPVRETNIATQAGIESRVKTQRAGRKVDTETPAATRNVITAQAVVGTRNIAKAVVDTEVAVAARIKAATRTTPVDKETRARTRLPRRSPSQRRKRRGKRVKKVGNKRKLTQKRNQRNILQRRKRRASVTSVIKNWRTNPIRTRRERRRQLMQAILTVKP